MSNVHTDELFKHLKIWYDEPFGDTSAFPTYLVSEYAKEKMTVVLTGDGGDEIFGGYKRFQKVKLLLNLPHIPNRNLKYFFSLLRNKTTENSFLSRIYCGLEVLGSDEIGTYAIAMSEVPQSRTQEYAKNWGIPRDYDPYWYYRKFYRQDLPILTRLQYLDFHTYLPSDILTKVDRVSMAVSLEARVPLLSRKIIEFIFSVPESTRFYRGKLKGLLKEAYKDILPPEILNRKKMGFGIPFRYFNESFEKIQERILKEIFGIHE